MLLDRSPRAIRVIRRALECGGSEPSASFALRLHHQPVRAKQQSTEVAARPSDYSCVCAKLSRCDIPRRCLGSLPNGTHLSSGKAAPQIVHQMRGEGGRSSIISSYSHGFQPAQPPSSLPCMVGPSYESMTNAVAAVTNTQSRIRRAKFVGDRTDHCTMSVGRTRFFCCIPHWSIVR